MPEKTLWTAVVLQACADIEHQHYFSKPYADAEAFFFDGGEWQQSRQHVADQIGIQVSDITRLGRRLVNERRLIEEPEQADEDFSAERHQPGPAPCPPTPRLIRRRDRQYWIQLFLEQQRLSYECLTLPISKASSGVCGG